MEKSQCSEDMCGWTRGACGYCSLSCTVHPGFQQDLLDGVCKAECNTPLCAFDAGDCVHYMQGFCAPGCFEAMLGDGTCQVQCWSQACGNDGGDCERLLCSPGCFPYMVDDGLCDEDCNVEECQWDGGDCDIERPTSECAQGCRDSMRGDGECNPECFTAACESDNGDCECAPGCLYSEVGQCKPECQVPECNYDTVDPAGLFCSHSSFDCAAVDCYDMWYSEAEQCDFTCEQCSMEIQYKMNCCEGCCSENYYPHPVAPSVCVRAPDRTSEQRPRIISVPSGPFDSLSAAFASIFERYVEVRLLPGAHALSSSKYFIDYTYPYFINAEHTQQAEGLKRLKVTSQACIDSPAACERAVIVLEDSYARPFFSFSGSRYLEVSNIDFTSMKPQELCANGNEQCLSEMHFFSIRDGMTARFVNVTFRHFNNSMTSILLVKNSTLALEHVDFIGITMRGYPPERGIITLDSASANYTSGRISLTNNLWDYGQNSQALGALTAIRGNLVITGVEFAHNFLAFAEQRSKLASLIELRDCWRVRITRCDFAFNVGRAVLSIFAFAWNVTSRDYGTAMAILDSRIEVANCTFRNNTGTVGSSIYVHYLAGQQNVLITNCTFLNEFAEENGIIVGYSRLPTTEIHGKSRVTLSGAAREVQYPVPRLTISQSLFRNCNVGRFGLIALTNIWSARIEAITVEEAAAEDARNVSTNSLEAWMAVPGARLPTSIPSVSLQQCQSLFNFTATARLEIESLEVARSRCGSVVTATGLSVAVSRSYFWGNRGFALSGFVLYIEGRSVSILDTVFEGNAIGSPNSKGAVYIIAAAVNISGCHFALNAASQGAALYLDNVKSADVSSCNFEHNAADMGGAVFIEGSGLMTFLTYSSLFRNNSAVSYGGAICIAPEQLNAKVSYADVVFEQCKSATGSAMFVSEDVVLLPGSRCAHCKFTENVSLQHGTCVFELVSGEMAFISSQFERNIGVYTSALYATFSVSEFAHFLVLSDTLFVGNEAQTTVTIAASSHLEVVGSSVACLNNTGTCLYFISANFTCSHCDFANNTAESGAGLQLHSSQVRCEDCAFDSNSGELTGGAVSAKSYSVFECRRCLFHNNTSQWQGGGLFLEQQSGVLLHSATFTSNTARRGGFALCFVLSDVLSVVRFSHFAWNGGANYGSISLISAALKLQGCEFAENFSTDSMGGLMLSQSLAVIESCKFANQTGILGVFIYATSSNVTISNSLLLNGTASNAGAGMVLISSQVSMSLCRFESLLSRLGGAVTAQDDSHLAVDSCSFQHIYSKSANRGVLTVAQSFLSLSNSLLSFYDQGGVHGVQASIAVTGSLFSNSSGTLGSGVTCEQCALLSIAGCSFQHLAADEGASVYLEGSAFQITLSEFKLCTGLRAGAVYVEENPGNITNCLFLSNSGHIGGAIHIGRSLLLSSEVALTGNRFHNNSAVRRGGAIFWGSTQPLLQGNDFSGNTAPYGPDIASYPVSLSITHRNTSFLTNVTSGRKIAQSLVLELLDTYGRVVADDYESIGQIAANANDTDVSGEVRVLASSGQFIFKDWSITAQPGTNTTIVIRASTSSLSISLVVGVSIRYCEKGENLASNICVPCASGTYSLTNYSSCSSCPSSAFCFGNFTIAPKPGYWRLSSDSDAFFKCPNPDACLGSPRGTNLTGVCADGYQGAKCQSCAPGHYLWGSLYCSKCPSTATRVSLHVCISVLILTALAAIVGLVLWRCAQLVFYVKVFVNYCQVVMLFKSSGLPWPQELLQLFNAYEVFGAFPEYVTSANCMMESYYDKLLAVAFAQPALILIVFLFWSVVAIIKRSARYLHVEFGSTLIVICFLAYPSVIRTMFESFRCEEVGTGEYWLLEHNIQCWTHQHTKFSLSLALPCIIVSGLALPALALIYLRRKQTVSECWNYATLGYSQERWHWEFAILYFKALVIACFSLLFHASKLFPALSAFGAILVISGVLVTRRRSIESEFNFLEVLSLNIWAATLYIGLMLSTGMLDSAASAAPFGAVLAMNVYFAGIFMRRAIAGIYRIIKKRIPQETEVRAESA